MCNDGRKKDQRFTGCHIDYWLTEAATRGLPHPVPQVVVASLGSLGQLKGSQPSPLRRLVTRGVVESLT